MFQDFQSVSIPICKDFWRKCLLNFQETKFHFISNVQYEEDVATNQVSELKQSNPTAQIQNSTTFSLQVIKLPTSCRKFTSGTNI